MITPSTVYPRSAREAMSRWPTGVAVVTTADRDGWWWGFTAGTVGQVSERPPVVSVCLARQAHCRSVFTAADAWAVHVLREGQEGLAGRFRSGGADFDGLAVACGFEDVPLLDDVAVRLECRAVRWLPVGDQVLLLGEVIRARTGPHEPMVRIGDDFRRLARPTGADGPRLAA